MNIKEMEDTLELDVPYISVNLLHSCKYLAITKIKHLIAELDQRPEGFINTNYCPGIESDLCIFGMESCDEIRTMLNTYQIILGAKMEVPNDILFVLFSKYPELKKNYLTK